MPRAQSNVNWPNMVTFYNWGLTKYIWQHKALNFLEVPTFALKMSFYPWETWERVSGHTVIRI